MRNFSPTCLPYESHQSTYLATLLITLTYLLKVKDSNCQHIRRLLLVSERCIYVWPWPILEVKVGFEKSDDERISPRHFDAPNSLLLKRPLLLIWQTLLTHRKSPIGFRLVYLHFTLIHSKGQSQGHTSVDCEYRKRWPIGQILLLPIHRMFPVGFWLAFLRLTLAYSKDQTSRSCILWLQISRELWNIGQAPLSHAIEWVVLA